MIPANLTEGESIRTATAQPRSAPPTGSAKSLSKEQLAAVDVLELVAVCRMMVVKRSNAPHEPRSTVNLQTNNRKPKRPRSL